MRKITALLATIAITLSLAAYGSSQIARYGGMILNAHHYRNQTVNVLVHCSYHAWRAEHDLRSGHELFAAYQAYKTAQHCHRF